MVLSVAHNTNRSSQGLHHFALGDGFLAVIRSFTMYVGTEISQNAFGVEFIKHHNIVDALQGRDEFRARFGAEKRSSRTLKGCNRAVPVDPHHQNVTLLSRPLEIAHVPHMQQVEATIGKGNAPPFAPQPLAQGCQILASNDGGA